MEQGEEFLDALYDELLARMNSSLVMCWALMEIPAAQSSRKLEELGAMLCVGRSHSSNQQIQRALCEHPKWTILDHDSVPSL